MLEYIDDTTAISLALVAYSLNDEERSFLGLSLLMLGVSVVLLIDDLDDNNKKKILFNKNAAFTCKADNSLIVKKDLGYRSESIYFIKDKKRYKIQDCHLVKNSSKTDTTTK